MIHHPSLVLDFSLAVLDRVTCTGYDELEDDITTLGLGVMRRLKSTSILTRTCCRIYLLDISIRNIFHTSPRQVVPPFTCVLSRSDTSALVAIIHSLQPFDESNVAYRYQNHLVRELCGNFYAKVDKRT
jgi:hypothetical protein